jgi:hypothetical protein
LSECILPSGMGVPGNRPESYEKPMRVLDPYTHARHATRCREAADRGLVLAGQLVQILKRNVVYCARIQHAWTTSDGMDCWAVLTSLPEVAKLTVPVRQVRQCGGPHCSCSPDFGVGRPAASAARRADGAGLEA